MSEIQEMVIDEMELEILTEKFENQSGKLGESHFTHCTGTLLLC